MEVIYICVRYQQLPHHILHSSAQNRSLLIPCVHRHPNDLSETRISFHLWRIWKLMDVGDLHSRQCLQNQELIAVQENGAPSKISFGSWQDTWTGNVL